MRLEDVNAQLKLAHRSEVMKNAIGGRECRVEGMQQKRILQTGLR